MRGKLRDKRDAKNDRSKRETLMGRRPSRRDNRNLQWRQLAGDDDDEYVLEEEGELVVADEQQN
jgi:hypothetical protein